MQSVHHTTDTNIKYDTLSHTNYSLDCWYDFILYEQSHPKVLILFPFLNKKHKQHKVYCQVVYVTFDISVTKKIKCSLAGAYNGKMGGVCHLYRLKQKINSCSHHSRIKTHNQWINTKRWARLPWGRNKEGCLHVGEYTILQLHTTVTTGGRNLGWLHTYISLYRVLLHTNLSHMQN